MSDEPGALDAEWYCREVEAHLCRRNDGHLVRLVGPAFEMVYGWAAQGIPLRVALAGIDQCFERYHRRGPRRRPMQIAFAEADVLDLFDDWRRALGVPLDARSATASSSEQPPAEADVDGSHRGSTSLPAHLERVISRLTVLRARPDVDVPRQDALTSAIRELDAMRASARSLRGDRRAQAVARLSALEAELAALFRATLPAERLREIEREAEVELAPFRQRMSQAAWRGAVEAAAARLAREAAGLPVVRYE